MGSLASIEMYYSKTNAAIALVLGVMVQGSGEIHMTIILKVSHR